VLARAEQHDASTGGFQRIEERVEAAAEFVQPCFAGVGSFSP
jgi:hypothetical protein